MSGPHTALPFGQPGGLHRDTAHHLLHCGGWPRLQLHEPPSLCWGSKAWASPCLSPLSTSCRPRWGQRGDSPFSYLPLYNKRPEPCSLLLSLSLPTGRSPNSHGCLSLAYLDVQLQSMSEVGVLLSDHSGLRAFQAPRSEASRGKSS